MSEGDRVLRTAAAACLAGGLMAFVALALAGRPVAGLALASGLAIGGLNGFLARRSLAVPINFGATSLFRLMLLSAAGIGVALLLYPASAWLLLLGIGLAQLVLTAVALREAIRG